MTHTPPLPKLPEKLRAAILDIRRKPYPISDLIPLLTQAADAVEALSQRGEAVGEVYGIDIDGDTASPLVEWTPEATDLPEGTKLFTAPQPAQPTDCPKCKGSEVRGFKRGIRCDACDGTGEAAQPAKPAPMTDEQAMNLAQEAFRDFMTDRNDDADIALVRAVESFHHIKEAQS